MMRLSDRLAARTRSRRPSIIRELLPLATAPGVISLGGGYPSPVTFPMDRVTIEAGQDSFSLDGRVLEAACQYGPSLGQSDLVAGIRAWHEAKSGVRLEPDQVCVTNGSQEGLFAAAYLFLDPGDPVMVTEPSYPGALAAFSAFTDNLLAIPQDENGMVPAAMEEYLQRRRRKNLAAPKFIYVTPNCHNPAGVSMNPDRRRRVYDLAERFDLLLLEDDPYELLKFREDDRPPPIQSIDSSGRVVRLDSFSKVFVPGFRIGYVSGPAEIVREFSLYKQGANLHSSSFDQSILAAYLGRVGPEGMFTRIRKNCEFYRANCEALQGALDRELGGRVSYVRPDGGFFLWLELKQDEGPIDTFEMIGTLAREMGVLAIPGSGFSVTGSQANCLRLSFSQQSSEQLAQGVRRLARMRTRYLETQARREKEPSLTTN